MLTLSNRFKYIPQISKLPLISYFIYPMLMYNLDYFLGVSSL